VPNPDSRARHVPLVSRSDSFTTNGYNFLLKRGPVLVIGAIFHLGIAILMGIVEFSVIMWVVYAVFFYEEWCNDVFRYAKNLWKNIQSRVAVRAHGAG